MRLERYFRIGEMDGYEEDDEDNRRRRKSKLRVEQSQVVFGGVLNE